MKLRFTLLILLTACWSIATGQIFPLDGTDITSCSGFFQDSGGGSAPYGPNENFEITICPDGSTGTHVQLNFTNTNIANGDLLCFFDGPDTGSPALSCSDDFPTGAFIVQATAVNPTGCLTVTFNSDAAGEDDGWSAIIECIPACQIITSVLDSSDPPASPVDTGWIDICPGDVVFFNGIGAYPQNGAVYNHSDQTSSFEWNFGDGTFGIGPNVSHTYTEPGGYIVQLAITDQFGCKNTNFISQRIRVATIPSFQVTDDLTICVGDTVSLDANVNANDSTAFLQVINPPEGSFLAEGIRSDSLPLPDGTGASYETSISFTEFSPGQVLTDLNDLLSICVVMEHSYLRDLEIELTCPDGTTVTLHNFAGQTGGEVFLGEPYELDEGFNPPIPGLGYEYCWTPFDNNGFTWIEYANTFFPGTLPEGNYAAVDDLSALLGCPLNGEWTIRVQDLWGIDNGYIFSWSINFNPDIYPDVETYQPNIIDWTWENSSNVIYLDQDSLVSSPFNAGNAGFQFTITDDFGCVWDTLVNVSVLPETHPDCFNCSSILTPFPDTVICEGDNVQIDVSATPDEPNVTFESIIDYEFGNSNHPPGNPYASTINVNSINPTVITDPAVDLLAVCINLETNFLSDLDIFLLAPNGTVLELTTGNGGGSDFYTLTCFSPTASTPITAGAPPYTGSFQPEGNWNDLIGSPINGDWSILISDDSGPTSFGTFFNWSITFNTTNTINYVWSGNDLSCSNCPDPTATPVDSTEYIVTATDSYGCLSFDTVNVNVLGAVDAPDVSCMSTGNGIIVFDWMMVDTFTQYEVNINNTGWIPANGNLMHTITGLGHGDVVDLMVQVQNNGNLCATLSNTASCISCFMVGTVDNFTNPTCAGLCDGTAEISVADGSPPYSFTISHEDGLYEYTQDNGSFSNLCPGLNMVVIGDITGCLDTVSFTLIDPPAMSIEVSELQAVSCNGLNNGQAIVEAMGGSGVYSYLWSDPLVQSLPTATLLAAGTYQVTVTDTNGCELIGSVEVTEPDPLLLFPEQTDALCFEEASGTGEVVVTGGTYPYSYVWDDDNNTTDSLVADLPQGTYLVEVTDANGCFASASIDVGQPATPVSAATAQTDISCFDENEGAATVIPAGGTGPNYSFAWDTNENTQSISGLAPGNYTVTVTDQNGCSTEESVTITEYDPMDILVIFSPVTCYEGSDGALAVTNIEGGSQSGNYVFTWDVAPTLNSDVIEGLPSGDYSVTVTDDEGCSAEGDIFLPQAFPIQIEAESEAVACFGEANGIASVISLQDTVGSVTYQWSQNTGGQQTSTATNLAAGFYTVQVTDSNGCTATAEVEVDQPAPIDLNFEVVPNDCFGESEGAINVEAIGGVGDFEFLWSNNSTETFINDLPSGTYIITVTDANNCKLSEEVDVPQPTPIAPLVNAIDVSCFGDRDGRVEIAPTGGTPPFLYSTDGVEYFGSSVLIGLEAGDYTVYVQDANGCIWIEDAFIDQPDPLNLFIEQGESVEISLGDEIDLDAFTENATGEVIITWSEPYVGTLSCLECATTTVNTQNTITYFASAVDELGCTDEEKITIYVDKERKLLVPTAFTPNNDNNNDLLLVHGQEGTRVTLFQVFDRWGELLYETGDFLVNDETVGWDGTFRSQEMTPGVFIWYVEVEYIDGVRETFKGSTTLIR